MQLFSAVGLASRNLEDATAGLVRLLRFFRGSSLLINDLKVTDSLCSKKSDLTTIQQQMRSEKLASFSLLRRISKDLLAKKAKDMLRLF